MCGRFVFNMGCERFEAAYAVQAPLGLEPRFNIAPTQRAAIIRFEQGTMYPLVQHQPSATMLEWGIQSHGKPIINARSETILEKPLFRDSMLERRCLVPATGWYEWRSVDGQKYPYHLSLESKQDMAFAGIWRGEEFSLLTTRAAEGYEHIHDRMPVILTRERWKVWLADTPLSEITAMLKPHDSRDLDAYIVGPRVGSVKNDDADLLEGLL